MHACHADSARVSCIVAAEAKSAKLLPASTLDSSVQDIAWLGTYGSGTVVLVITRRFRCEPQQRLPPLLSFVRIAALAQCTKA